MDVTYAAILICSWIARHEAKGITVPADPIWQRIRDPKTEEWQQEAVFQAVS